MRFERAAGLLIIPHRRPAHVLRSTSTRNRATVLARFYDRVRSVRRGLRRIIQPSEPNEPVESGHRHSFYDLHQESWQSVLLTESADDTRWTDGQLEKQRHD